MSANENNTDSEFETRILTHDEVDKQISYFFAPLTRQLEDLTRLIQGMFTAHRSNLFPRESTSASFSATGPSPDIEKQLRILFQSLQSFLDLQNQTP